jgi:hypothetical protein
LEECAKQIFIGDNKTKEQEDMYKKETTRLCKEFDEQKINEVGTAKIKNIIIIEKILDN